MRRAGNRARRHEEERNAVGTLVPRRAQPRPQIECRFRVVYTCHASSRNRRWSAASRHTDVRAVLTVKSACEERV